MRIDHLVWYNADLAAGRRHFAERLGTEPAYGGEHPREGTANALLSLGAETYIEILGRDVAQPDAALDPEVAGLQGQGLYHWAVGGADLAALARNAARAGLEAGPPVAGGRVKPDGTRLDWVCWGLRGHGFGALVPFFIDWRGSEHPARSAPAAGRVARFGIDTPEPVRLQAIFDVLQLDLPVRAAATPRVEVTIENGEKDVTLTSFAPVPRGYVI